MTTAELTLIAIAAGGFVFAGFVFWLIRPDDERGAGPKPDIKPAE